MARLLSDEEVFGSSPGLLSDEEVFGEKKEKRRAGMDIMGTRGEKRQQKGRLKNVDYKTGLRDTEFRSVFSMQDSDQERATMLDTKFGEEHWGQDKAGNYIISAAAARSIGIKTDSPIAIDEDAVTRYDLYDFIGDAGPTVAAIATGIATAPASPLVAIPATMAAYGGTKALQETAEQLGGINTQTLGEVAKDIGIETLQEGAFEAGFRMLKPLGRMVFPNVKRGPRPNLWKEGDYASTIPKERQELTLEAFKMGATPSIYQASAAHIPGRIQQMWRAVVGNPMEEANARALQEGQKKLVNKFGKEVARTDGAGKLARSIRNEVQDAVATQDAKILAHKKEANRLVKVAQNKLRSNISKGTILPEQIRDSIRSYKEGLSEAAQGIYGSIHDLVRGQPVVATDLVSSAYKDIVDEFAKTNKGRAIQLPGIVSDAGNVERFITLKQAATLRTQLRNARYDPDILKTIDQRQIARLETALNNSIDNAGKVIGERSSQILQADGKPFSVKLSIDQKQAQLAANRLRDAQAWYKEKISKLNDLDIRMIARYPEEQGAVPADVIASKLLGIKDPARIRNFKEVVGDGAFDRIAKLGFDDMWNNRTNPLTGEIDAVGLAKDFRNMGRSFGVWFDPKQGQQMKNLLEEIGAMNGELTAENLARVASPTEITGVLQTALKQAQNRERFLSNDFIKKVYQGDIDDDNLIRTMLMSKKGTTYIRQVKSLYEKTNPQRWEEIQQQSMDFLTRHMYKTDQDPLLEVISGMNLEKAINQFDPTPGKERLKLLFGDSKAKELLTFVDTVKFVTSKPKGMSGALVAAEISLHPIRHLPKLLQIKFMSKLFNKEDYIKWFAGMLDPKKYHTRTQQMEYASRIALYAYAFANEEATASEEFPSYDKLQELEEIRRR